MAVRREYRCDLCNDNPKTSSGDPDLIGMHWGNYGVVSEAPWHTVERHICAKCLSSLQAFKPVCQHGVRGCYGGPRCLYEHD